MSKLPRRSFIERISLGLAYIFAAPAVLRSEKFNEIDFEMSEQTNPIKEIRPLGFQWQTQDPFLFCVHHEDYYPKGNSDMGPNASLSGRQIGQDFVIKDGWRMYHGSNVPGFPGHPHRGFETITVVRKGMVDHADSLGAAGRYGDGDVQWMTAGKGVQHSEMFPLLKENDDNPLELFQLWLNLPKKGKMVDPHFKMLWSESIPVMKSPGVEVEVIAGTLTNQKAPTPPPNSWAFASENEVAVWNIQLEANTTWTLPKASGGLNRTLYYYKGEGLELSGTTLQNYHAADVVSNLEIELKTNSEAAKILVLQGKPINEPVVQHGPFVMNTREEIMQAFQDYQKDEFGGWPWPRRDQVHDKSKGRFAKHADGTVENKG